MKFLFDTNVLIDAFTCRDYDYKSSRDLVFAVLDGKLDGYISAKQITDIYYILRKYIPDESKKRYVIKTLLDSFKILPLLGSDLSYCLDSKIDDFEDAVLCETAKVNMINCIVTKNVADFEKSDFYVLEPREILSIIEQA